MSDRLRDLLADTTDWHDWHEDSMEVVFAAAGRFLALTETGQQKQAAHLPREQSYVVSVDGPGRYWVVRSDDE